MGITDVRDLWGTPLRLFLVTYVRSSINIGIGIESVWRFCIRNLNGCDIDTDGWEDSFKKGQEWGYYTEIIKRTSVYLQNISV